MDQPSASEQIQSRWDAARQRLGRLDRRLWPPIAAGAVLLVVALVVALNTFAKVPGVLWLLLPINPLLMGCALWFLYECLRHLIIERTRTD